eukprot:6202846-Pleurochrysis_carterae.AAC.5
MSEARSPDKASVPPSEPPVASAASGVLSLLGTWQGDAVVRRPSKSKASKGFGTGLPRGGKGGRSMQKARGGAVASKLFEKDVTVFKVRQMLARPCNWPFLQARHRNGACPSSHTWGQRRTRRRRLPLFGEIGMHATYRLPLSRSPPLPLSNSCYLPA